MVRRKTRRTSIFSAMVLEIATLLGIVVIAQPTWSRLFIETVSQRPTATQKMPAAGNTTVVEQRPVATSAPNAWPVIDTAFNYVAQRPEFRSQNLPLNNWQAPPAANSQPRFAQQPIAPAPSAGPSYSFDDYK